MIRDHLLGFQDEILACSSVSEGELRITRRFGDNSGLPHRPLYVGTSAISLPGGQIVVVGGGATCFSMGTFWNKGVYTLFAPQDQEGAAGQWVHEKTLDIIPGERSPPTRAQPAVEGSTSTSHIQPIPRDKLGSQDDFARILREGRPVVLEGLDLGKCVSTWDLKSLTEKVGKDHKVSTLTNHRLRWRGS